MFVPLHDDTPLKVIRFQHVTIFIIAINVLVYLMTGAFTSENALMAYRLGLRAGAGRTHRQRGALHGL